MITKNDVLGTVSWSFGDSEIVNDGHILGFAEHIIKKTSFFKIELYWNTMFHVFDVVISPSSGNCLPFPNK